MVGFGNGRQTSLISASARLTALIEEQAEEGQDFRELTLLQPTLFSP
jgi:hypothetical protein